ncbi:Peroxisomal targeting signal receptor [Pseudocercospora fuligena]|uniref:Peroxisomal targeting signal receptor n=1 Tax=Pseudocercospora fuligena TaxID=685502 RepID=A0A8H6R9F1_9PEZI|nr:Peroxisomal targeting signal receptor [Pseudocercospora fuligena]
MSFLGGPECSTGANPLAQFQKQTGADTSLQRDRLASRQPQQLNGFRSGPQLPEDAAFQDFAQQGPRMGEMLPNDTFHMEQMRREAEHLERVGGGGGGGNGWASDFAQKGPHFAPEEFLQQQRNGAFSPADFQQFRQSQMTSTARTASPTNSYQSAYRQPIYGNSFGMQRPMMFNQPQMWNQQPQQQYEGKGKGRVQELSDTDWEKQFEELSTADKEADLDQLDREANEAMERELNQVDRSETGWGDYESIMEGVRQEANAHRDMLADEELANHFGDEYDQWKDFDGLNHNFDPFRGELGDYATAPESGTYMFEENNVFKDHPNAYEEGMKIMREGGNLSLAALAFEAAVQKDQSFVDAWVALGQAQAQNEKESPAIRALEQAIKLDPSNQEALMGLAVSYTNEGYDSLAYRTLERWVAAKYPQLGVTPRGMGEEEELGFTDRHLLHEKVTNYFLEAAQLNPEGAEVDVDVQVGLGVLFYGSEDYDKAVDCFTAALNSHQHGSMKREGEEHLLWNRLGATLANSNRSEEAIEAYSRALELRPNFVRARYNLGVSCINLGVLEEAASHLLGALSMHRVLEQEGRAKAAELMKDGHGNDIDERDVDAVLQQNQSTNLYDTLRRVFTQMQRRDLSAMVGPDMDLDRLRGEFDF